MCSPRTHTHISITNEPVHSLSFHCFLKTIVLFQVLQREIEERGKEINSLVRRCQPATDGAADGKNPTRLCRYARHLERSWHHIWIRSLENQCHTEQYLKRHSAVLVSYLIYRLLINLLSGFLHLWFINLLFCYIDSVVVYVTDKVNFLRGLFASLFKGKRQFLFNFSQSWSLFISLVSVSLRHAGWLPHHYLVMRQSYRAPSVPFLTTIIFGEFFSS